MFGYSPPKGPKYVGAAIHETIRTHSGDRATMRLGPPARHATDARPVDGWDETTDDVIPQSP